MQFNVGDIVVTTSKDPFAGVPIGTQAVITGIREKTWNNLHVYELDIKQVCTSDSIAPHGLTLSPLWQALK